MKLPPLFVQFPPTVTFPANVTTTPGLISTFPNVIAEDGVIIVTLVNVTLFPALNVSAVDPALKAPPIFTFDPDAVENTGLFTPPYVRPPLKLIVPAPVTDRVPELSVSGLLKVIVPVVTLITSLAVFELEA
jgi:hypothetical protein